MLRLRIDSLTEKNNFKTLKQYINLISKSENLLKTRDMFFL